MKKIILEKSKNLWLGEGGFAWVGGQLEKGGSEGRYDTWNTLHMVQI